ncbi:putative peroxisomal membrane protein PMP27 [Calycina marina]|uniref:Peroxisomal membrane protein PMP27 n=1 Tax=Calycina marina TaxID=1763456 RepID=A0A9P7Z6S1_9HELO|nr:putative peroxisomal membrane protein PMP27 [Calycina marina]
MVADALVYHPSVTHYLKFVSTTAGRDKILRTVQYFSRFYAWYLFRTNGAPSEIAPWEAAKKSFGLIRKGMRLGKNVEHFKAASVAADSKSLDPIIKYCTVGRQLGYAGYLSLDAVTFLDVAGIRKSPSTKNLATQAARFWMTGILFSTVSGLYSLYNLRQQEGRVDKKEGEGVVASKRIEKEKAAISKQLIQDLCDLVVPATTLGYTNFDDGFVGLAGTVSSLLGVHSQWKKTA